MMETDIKMNWQFWSLIFQVNLNATSLENTSCLCNHLTSFGGFYVPPNPLPPFTMERFKQGYGLTITVGVILLLYLIGLIVVRRFDIGDKAKVCIFLQCSWIFIRGILFFFYHWLNQITWLFLGIIQVVFIGK